MIVSIDWVDVNDWNQHRHCKHVAVQLYQAASMVAEPCKPLVLILR